MYACWCIVWQKHSVKKVLDSTSDTMTWKQRHAAQSTDRTAWKRWRAAQGMQLEEAAVHRSCCSTMLGTLFPPLTQFGVYAEAWRGGLHKAAQVAEEAQAGPYSALHASPGAIPISKADPSCAAHHLHQACPLCAVAAASTHARFSSACVVEGHTWACCKVAIVQRCSIAYA